MILYDGNSLFSTAFYSTLRAVEKGDIDANDNKIDGKSLSDLYMKANLENDKDVIKLLHPTLIKMVTTYILTMVKEINTNHRAEYGEPVFVFDVSPSWRYGVYPEYKSSRKKKDRDIFYETLFKPYIQNIKKVFKESHYSVIDDVKVSVDGTKYGYGVEGDDIIATIIKMQPSKKHLIVSSDNDFIQLCGDNVHQYSILHKKMLDTPDEMTKRMWLEQNIILGQSKDSVPSIISKSQFDKDFIKWLEEKKELSLPKDISQEEFEVFESKLKDEIDEYREHIIKESEKKIEEGKAKKISTKSAYKLIRFGEKGIEKVVEEYGSIEAWLDENPLFKKRYELNKTLLDLNNLPDYVFKPISDIVKANILAKGSGNVNVTDNMLSLDDIDGFETKDVALSETLSKIGVSHELHQF